MLLKKITTLLIYLGMFLSYSCKMNAYWMAVMERKVGQSDLGNDHIHFQNDASLLHGAKT
jgi:hypothetical protein